MEMTFTYAQLRKLQSLFEKNMNNVISQFNDYTASIGAVKNSFGLYPDEIRMSPEYRYYKIQIQEAGDKLRWVSSMLARHYKKQYRDDLRAERDARRGAGIENI